MSVGIYNADGTTWHGGAGTQERELTDQYQRWSREVVFERPYASNLLEQIARSYDRDANWWVTQDCVLQRLGY